MANLFVALGAALAFLGVALGAFGAHGLKGKITPEMLEIYQTGVQYHLIHALGLILIGLLIYVMPSHLLNWAGWLLAVGIIIFSGSLYALSMTGVTKLGAITPIGGVAFLIGWILVVIAALAK
ncbi:uncharacterized membrane protein YgdD (TMEM256/DUF423 family) [Caldalkalibacillus uzonensis]|uniref:Uncharacterized membrane protein YgdD (TMEM256/DUF423 family) n=1 Tax=Caldalkalibacillus uzonensis TaxID=353224 RepID=A0ABU0CQE3_9BACI|nr:DUF423 domain-containing protein [Caldalkalibacillus uzonensis]MDQ0338119.1 uncharacterized membrane protein YgdD (TMEM256/DUF423 family) [Caldalkalibacillus uzonensis]